MAPNKRLLTNSLNEINYRGQLTDSPAAVERAIYELKTNGRENANKYIVFMTDGIVDTGNAAADVEKTKWLREELAVDAADNGIKVFAVAFTENADFFLIQSLAKKSSGEYFRALSPADLSGVFAEMRERIEEPPQAVIAVVPNDGSNSSTSSASTSGTSASSSSAGSTPTITSSASSTSAIVSEDAETAALLASISPEDLEALREISEIEGIPIEQLAKELYGSGEETEAGSGVVITRPARPGEAETSAQVEASDANKSATSSTSTLVSKGAGAEDSAAKGNGAVDAETSNLLASISPEDLEALREISEIEGIPIEQLAKELYGSGEETNASSGVVITRPGEPPVRVEQEQPRVLMSIIAAAAGLLALVILVVWFFRRKRKQQDTDADQSQTSARVAVRAPAAFLHDISGLALEPLINLDSQPLMIGRVAGAADEHLKYLIVNAPTVGRRHAVVKYKDKAFWLVDQGSVNGTYVNDNRLSGECQLRHGDRIRFHNAEFEFTQPDASDAGETMVGEAIGDDATIVADAGTMVGLAAVAPAAAVAAGMDDAEDMFAGDIDISSDAAQDLTLEGTEEAENIETPVSPDDFAVPSNISLAETSIDEIFDVTGEDVVPAVLEDGGAGDVQQSHDGPTQVMDATELPDAASLSGAVVAAPSGDVDDEFDAEASAFFDDNTVGPVVDHEAGPYSNSNEDKHSTFDSDDDDGDIFSVDGTTNDVADSAAQAALDEKLERARALAEADSATQSPPTEAVDFNHMDTMVNMEGLPQEDANDVTLDDFIETNAFQKSPLSSASTSPRSSPDAAGAGNTPGGETSTITLDRFVDTGKFDAALAAETMALDKSSNGDFDETATLPTNNDNATANINNDTGHKVEDEEIDDGADFFNDGSEDPTEMK